MKSIFAILPCYNEELNIGDLIDEWNQQRDGLSGKGYEPLQSQLDHQWQEDPGEHHIPPGRISCHLGGNAQYSHPL